MKARLGMILKGWRDGWVRCNDEPSGIGKQGDENTWIVYRAKVFLFSRETDMKQLWYECSDSYITMEEDNNKYLCRNKYCSEDITWRWGYQGHTIYHTLDKLADVKNLLTEF